MRSLKPRQRQILNALAELGGRASIKQIAEKTGLSTNGISQTMGAFSEKQVRFVEGKGGQAVWRLPELWEV